MRLTLRVSRSLAAHHGSNVVFGIVAARREDNTPHRLVYSAHRGGSTPSITEEMAERGLDGF